MLFLDHIQCIFPCIDLIITKKQLKLQYSELTYFWPLTVWLYQKEFSVLFGRLIISCSKLVSSTHCDGPMNEERRFEVLLQIHCFTIISLMLFPLFLKLSFIFKDLWTHLVHYYNQTFSLLIQPGQFYSTNKSGFWILFLLTLSKMCPRIFLKNVRPK